MFKQKLVKKKSCGLLLIILLFMVHGMAHAQKTNVIIMIVDGWGYNHILTTDYWNGTTAAYESWEVAYGMSTYMYNGEYDATRVWTEFNYVKSKYTDSAAAATAMSSGIKTRSGYIGMNHRRKSVEHILERAESRGMATGVITSVEISHATPAGFVAHNISRANYSQIAQEMIQESTVDVIMGAGHPLYDNNNQLLASGFDYQYIGGKILWNKLLAGTAGGDADGDEVADPWTLIQTPEAFRNLAEGDTPKRVIGVAQVKTTLQEKRSGAIKEEPPYSDPFNEHMPTLEEMTKAALNILDNDPDGLFLMIESGAVDWANHDNLLCRMIEEMDDFNHAVDAVVSWVETNSNWEETLVIVTGDHETGYLWGPDSGIPDIFNTIIDNGPGNLPDCQYYSGGHTNSLIPFYAKGLNSDQFAAYAINTDNVRGTYIDNINIAHLIFNMWGGFSTDVEK